jgi:lipoprotein-anchoring transpeptidase ErfK/SrfK
MNAKLAPVRFLATSAAIAGAVLAFAASADPAAAQYGRNPQYGRPYPYGGDPQYGRPSQYGRDPQYRAEGKRDPALPRTGPAPLLAVVALSEQRVTLYDAEGRKMLQSPVSTGATSFETPAGIYSVVQKKEVHQSNVYEDGNMPFMQRITWTGIALHAGVLPGQPASHGCVRLPLPFAQRIFGMTDIGLRVIVVRDDILPRDISHAALFRPNPMRREASLAPAKAPSQSDLTPGSARHMESLKAQATAKSAEADAATKKATAARQAAVRKATEAANAAKQVRTAETSKAKAEELLAGAERALENAGSAEGAKSPSVKQAEAAKEKAEAKLAEAHAQPEADKEKAAAKLAEAQAQLEAAKEKAAAKLVETRAQLASTKEKAAARLVEAQAQLEAAKAQAKARTDEATRAEDEAKAAEAARELAVEASIEATRKMSPVSVFISRKTQRLYIRQGYIPVFEGPIAIREPEKPIGSYVFTALGYHNTGEVRWSVVSMYQATKGSEPAAAQEPRRKGQTPAAEPAPADVAGAQAALDRVVIPRDVVERVSEVVLPGASLIVSDEGASIETGKDTDFVVLMSGEPQGGIKTRRREQPRYRDGDFFGGGGGSFVPFFNW